MKDAPLVSVLIPTHNRPDFLVQSLQSVLDNCFEDFEIIVSDNSADGRAEPVVKQISDQRIRYIRQIPPSDKSTNWSHAAYHACGTYCFKLDDDDVILPGFLSRCADFMEKHPTVGSIFTGFQQIDLRNKKRTVIIDKDFFGPSGMVAGEKYARAVLTNEGGYPLNQKTAGFYRRSLAENIHFYDHASEDFTFTVALAFQADVSYIPDVLYEWRIHHDNSVHDFETLYFVSKTSLEKMEKMPWLVKQPDLAAKWLPLIQACKQALPLFYLHASFRSQKRKASWSLFHKLRATSAIPFNLRLLAMLVYGFLFPRFFRERLFAMYMNTHWIRRLIQSILGTKSLRKRGLHKNPAKGI